MTSTILLLFLRKELRDLRSNRQVWPAWLLLPGLAVLFPVLLLLLLPILTDPARAPHDPAVQLIFDTLAGDPGIVGATQTERAARLLFRDLGLYYLLMPVVLAATSAALSIVREKEQRTLEPILATPLRDRDLLLAKLIAAVGPALLVTWTAAIAGSLVGMVGSWWRLGVPILPTAGNVVAILLLAPVLSTLAALGGLRASSRFTDAPAATQYTGLVVVPVSLIVVAITGRPVMAFPLAGLGAAVGLGVVAFWIYLRTVRRFRREEILSRWR